MLDLKLEPCPYVCMYLCCRLLISIAYDFYACTEFPHMWNHFIPIKNKMLCCYDRYGRLPVINASPETEVEDFDHHVENVPYATILYHPTFFPLFHHSHHVFR